MRSIIIHLDPDLRGKIANLIQSPAMGSAQGRQTERLAFLPDAKFEPPAEVFSHLLRELDRALPPLAGQPNRLVIPEFARVV